MLNSRPLTPVSFVDGVERPLTPNDLLLFKPGLGLPRVKTDNSDLVYLNRWRRVQAYVDLFWKRWASEYLPTIRTRQKWHEIKRNVLVNDVVIVMDNSVPRSQWPLGRVIRTFPDARGLVQSVVVKNKFGEFKRPIRKVCVVVPADHRAPDPAWISSV